MMKLFFKSLNTHSKGDPYESPVTAQAVEFLYRNLAGVTVGTTVPPIATVLVMWGQINHVLLIAWFSAVIAVIVVRLLLSRAYLRCISVTDEAKRWGRYYSMTSLVSGLLWGTAALLFFVPDSTVHQVFMVTIIFALVTGSIFLNAYWIESYYAFTFPVLLAVSLRQAIEGGAENLILAVTVVMFLIVISPLAQSSRKSVLAAIRLRFENLDLVERLREEKEKAERVSHDKTRFLASASHDLRQPVHALTLFADALAVEVHSVKGKELLSNVGRSIDALNQLLESLLDISKLDAHIIRPNIEHFALCSLLDALHTEYAPQAQAQGLAWKLNMEKDLIVHSDSVLLGTMLRNLISNAIRYTRAGSVEMFCTRQGEEVRIEVRDTGIGIPQEQHRDIFREFYQLTNSERDRSKGLGLGLAIVDRLATLLQHRIELDSEFGKGSSFTIILPVGDAAAISIEAPQPYFGHRDVYGMRVVVIDDEQAVREGTQAVLESWGCEVILAGSEEEAVEKLKDCVPPHIIIADYRLREGKTGAQAIERLRVEFGKDIPALIITGDTDPERLREAQASGHALMHKPVQPAKLRAYLRRVQRRKA